VCCSASVSSNRPINSGGKDNDNNNNDDETFNRQRLATTKKMRLLGMQSNQARRALAIYDEFVYEQKKTPDIRMFAVAINCAMIANDLNKGREIHRLIERDFPQLKDNLMLKQQLRYFYVKCNDQLAAEQLFESTKSDASARRDNDVVPDDRTRHGKDK
jgi:hypothetical protein